METEYDKFLKSKQKRHVISGLFYQFIGTWAIMLNKPNDIGFEMPGYNLPSLNLIEKQITIPKRDNGSLLMNGVAALKTIQKLLRQV